MFGLSDDYSFPLAKFLKKLKMVSYCFSWDLVILTSFWGYSDSVLDSIVPLELSFGSKIPSVASLL